MKGKFSESYTKETDSGGDSISGALVAWYQRLSLRIRQGEKEVFK